MLLQTLQGPRGKTQQAPLWLCSWLTKLSRTHPPALENQGSRLHATAETLCFSLGIWWFFLLHKYLLIPAFLKEVGETGNLPFLGKLSIRLIKTKFLLKLNYLLVKTGKVMFSLDLGMLLHKFLRKTKKLKVKNGTMYVILLCSRQE